MRGWVNARLVGLVVAVAPVADEVDDDVLAERAAGTRTRDASTRTAASGSSPFTWKIGACTILATSVGYTLERPSSGAVVNPSWLLTTMWTVPPTS